MSNNKNASAPMEEVSAQTAKGTVISDAYYNTSDSVLQEGNLTVTAFMPPTVSERPKPSRGRGSVMDKMTVKMNTAVAMLESGANQADVNAFLKGALKSELKSETTKPRLKQAILETTLDDMGISIRFNRITHEVEFSGVDRHFPALEEHDYFEALPVKFSDMLVDSYTHAETSDIERYFTVTALEHGYNPVLELITAQQWDGRDRISELFGIMGVTDELSKTLIYKWSLQAIALLHNTLKLD